MGVKLTQSVINRFKHIARSLPPSKRRAFQASVALEFWAWKSASRRIYVWLVA